MSTTHTADTFTLTEALELIADEHGLDLDWLSEITSATSWDTDGAFTQAQVDELGRSLAAYAEEV